jgi:hypothetical protein
MTKMRSVGVVMAVLVTADIGVRVGKHYWRAYDPFDKFFAVFVLLTLAIFPLLAIWRENSGKRVEFFEVYFLILLVSQLFR